MASRDRKIARALFEVQRADAPAPRLSLEQIAARKLNGEGWDEVAKAMKAQGLATATSLGRVFMDGPKAAGSIPGR